MKKVVSLGTALACASIGGAAWAAHHDEESAPRAPEAIYAQVCGYCHGRNVGPVIRGRALPASVVKILVRTGPNAMPAFRPTEISDPELEALANWIQQSEADPEETGQ